MKKTLGSIIIIILFAHAVLIAQNPIPNGGFEDWGGNTPDYWAASTNIPGVGEPITKSTDSFSGLYSARGEVLLTANSLHYPVLYTGSLTDPSFPVSDRYYVLSGYYKFFPQGEDRFNVLVAFGNYTSSVSLEKNLEISSGADAYTYFQVEVNYDLVSVNWTPQYGHISFTISAHPDSQDVHAGSAYYVDHLTFDGQPVNIKEHSAEIPSTFILEQNYPNPFNPSTKIKFSIPAENENFRQVKFVSLKIYDILGNETAVLVNEIKEPGNYEIEFDASNLSSGIYFYELKSGYFSQTRKLVLVK